MNIEALINRFLGRQPARGPMQPTVDEVVPMMQGDPTQNYMAGGFNPAAQQYVDPLAPLPPGQPRPEPRKGGIKARMARNAGPGAQNFMGGENMMTFNVPRNVSGGIRKAIGKIF